MPDPEDTRRLVQWNREQKALPPHERHVWGQVQHLLEAIALRGEALRARCKLVPHGELMTWFASQLELVEQNTRAEEPLPLRGCSPTGRFEEQLSGIQSLVLEAVRDVENAEIRLAAERFNQQLEEWKRLSRHRRHATARAEAIRLLADVELCRVALLVEMQEPELD